MSTETNQDETSQPPFQFGDVVRHQSGDVIKVATCVRVVAHSHLRWAVYDANGNRFWARNCGLVERPKAESDDKDCSTDWLASYEFHVLAQRHAEWSRATFGADKIRGPVGSIKHLRKEIDEILANPSDPMEYADAFLLLLDAARRADIGSVELLRAAARKLEINKAREWPKIQEADAAIEHIRKMEPEEKTPGVSFEFVKSADLEPVAYSGGEFVGISSIEGTKVYAASTAELRAEIETLSKQRDEAREELKEATAEFVRALSSAYRERDEVQSQLVTANNRIAAAQSALDGKPANQ